MGRPQRRGLRIRRRQRQLEPEDRAAARLAAHADAALHQRARSEEHTSELQSLMRISYAVFCLKKTTTNQYHPNTDSHTPQPYSKTITSITMHQNTDLTTSMKPHNR